MKSRLSVALAGALLIGATAAANADYVVTLEEETGAACGGASTCIVESGSGSIVTVGLTPVGSFTAGGIGVAPSDGDIGTGIDGDPVEGFTGFTGPANFGTGGFTTASTAAGNVVQIIDSNGELFLPTGFVSGNPLSGSATFDDTTLALLGATPGTYTWTWGGGCSADQCITLDIVNPAPGPIAGAGLPG
jgi:hypothetical protein